jgi:hypothetical protein
MPKVVRFRGVVLPHDSPQAPNYCKAIALAAADSDLSGTSFFPTAFNCFLSPNLRFGDATARENCAAWYVLKLGKS